MAGRNRPSFLKKQKEQQRRARADRKREERRARRQRTSAEGADLNVLDETGATLEGEATGESDPEGGASTS